MKKSYNFGYYMAEGFHSIFTHGLMSFTAVFMIVACLLIMGSFSLVAVNLEQELGMAIVTSKRVMTMEKMTQIDEKYLELGDYNCLAVVSSQTYNGDGIMFEYTQSRHRPDYFCFQDNATRHV